MSSLVIVIFNSLQGNLFGRPAYPNCSITTVLKQVFVFWKVRYFPICERCASQPEIPIESGVVDSLTIFQRTAANSR